MRFSLAGEAAASGLCFDLFYLVLNQRVFAQAARTLCFSVLSGRAEEYYDCESGTSPHRHWPAQQTLHPESSVQHWCWVQCDRLWDSQTHFALFVRGVVICHGKCRIDWISPTPPLSRSLTYLRWQRQSVLAEQTHLSPWQREKWEGYYPAETEHRPVNHVSSWSLWLCSEKMKDRWEAKGRWHNRDKALCE